MIEALVALLVLALGMLGMARLHAHNLSESRNTNARSDAVLMVSDLQERIRMNPSAITATGNAYVSAWGAAPVPPKNCQQVACDTTELAAHDLREWKQRLAATLPDGDARIFVPAALPKGNRDQLGVIVSWTEIYARGQAEAADRSAAALAEYRNAQGVWLNSNAQGTGDAGVTCPADRSCHLVYIRP